MRTPIAAVLLLALASCGGGLDDGVVDVAFIGTPQDMFAGGVRLESAAQHLRAAQAQGLVRLDAAGNVVPGLAEAWIVTDDGRSYIFRLAEFDLSGGQRLTAQGARDSLLRTRRQLQGTSLGLDLAKIAEIRAMTGRVIEFRLTGPMPDFLQLLAQPELGIEINGAVAGPMRSARQKDVVALNAMPPEQRGLPAQPDWEDALHEVRAYAVSAARATEGFSDGRYDLVLGGTLANLPLASTGPLTRGTLRLDSAIGLFGLDVQRRAGFLASTENREALAMAIDREALVQPFGIGGWIATTRLVAPGLPGDGGSVGERWSDLAVEARQARAAARVARWRSANGTPPRLAIFLPPGPGSDTLFTALARDLAAIGVSTRRAERATDADLVLRDRVARYGDPRWFLNQFACPVSPRQCAEGVDYLVQLSLSARSQAEAASYLSEAEATLTGLNLFIPLGAPIRWSQVRANLPGFTENPWALHPLFPLSRAPM